MNITRSIREVLGVEKQASEDREKVSAAVNYRIEWVAGRDKLDLNNPADWAVAAGKVFAPTYAPQTPYVLARLR